jgi:hypothetical protein
MTTHTLQHLINLTPFEHSVAHWKLKATPKIQLTATDLLTLFSQSTRKQIFLSIGHDNYKVVPGGVQLCIQREQQLANANGILYLNIHPFQPLPRLAHLDEAPDPWMDLVLDGMDIGTIRMSELTTAVKSTSEAGSGVSCIIHQLLGHSPEHIADLVKSTGQSRVLFWLHDFFSLCVSHALQRNNLSFCGAPPQESNACSLCVYGDERQNHLARINWLFEELQIDLISPSEATLLFWEAHTKLKTHTQSVIPHISLQWKASTREKDAKRGKPHTRPRIGFLGNLAPHKGWPLFEQIASDSEFSQQFEFYALTAARSVPKGIHHIQVKASAEHPDAMANAVAANGLDLVLHWPSCHETFSLTTHEALIGGAYVVTNKISGNVAATINRLDKGVVLDSAVDLLQFLSDGSAASLSSAARASRSGFEVCVEHSQLSLSYFEYHKKQ